MIKRATLEKIMSLEKTLFSSPNQVPPKREKKLLPRDARELKKVSEYADEKNGEIKKLSDEFTSMGKLKLIWDSKVPEKDKKFYNFFTLTASNKEDVLKEIEKYQDFYEELGDAADKVRNPEKQTDAEKQDPHGTIINELKEKLSEMHETAKLGKDATASSELYRLHKSFVQKHEKLENMITRVENIALREGYNKANVGWQNSIRRVNVLESKLENSVKKFDTLSEQFEKLMNFSEKLVEQRENLLDDNQKMEEEQKSLKHRNQKFQEEQENLRQKNKEMEEEQEKLRQKNQEMVEEQEKLRERNMKMEDEQKILLEKNQKMEEEQEFLQQENAAIKTLLKTISKHEKFDKQ